MATDSIQLTGVAPAGVVFVYYDTSEQPYSTASGLHEAWQDGHYANYRVTATQQGTSNKWVVTRPAGVALVCTFVARLAASGVLANETPLGQGGVEAADLRAIKGGDFSLAPYPFSVSPILAQTSAADPPAKRIEVSQNSTPLYPFTCVDATGTAIDLSAKTVRFVAASDDGVTITPLFQYQTGGSGVTIAGASNNVAEVQFAAADTASARTLRFWLWNITDKQLLAKGTLDILAAVQSYP